MNPELTAAVQERVDLGHTKDQIAAELRQAGYTDEAIDQVYGSVTGAVSPIPPAATLIGYNDLLKQSFALVKEHSGLFGTAILYVIAATVVAAGAGFGLFTGLNPFDSEASLLLGFGLLAGLVGVVWYVFVIMVMVGLQRAVLLRHEAPAAPLHSYFGWSLWNLWGVLLISIYTQFAIYAGLLFLLIPGLALSIYLMFAPFIRVLELDKGVRALTHSTELVYGRWWSVSARFLYLMLCLLGIILVGGIVTALVSVVAGEIGMVIAGVVLVPVFVLSGLVSFAAMIILFESLRDSYTPFAADKSRTLRRVLWAAVIIGIPVYIGATALDAYTQMQALQDPAGFNLDFEIDDADMLNDPEFDAFMEEFGGELQVQ